MKKIGLLTIACCLAWGTTSVAQAAGGGRETVYVSARGSDETGNGTAVSYNIIHDVYSYDYGGWGLYTDEGSTGVEMSHNLVYRCKSGGFHQYYGKDFKTWKKEKEPHSLWADPQFANPKAGDFTLRSKSAVKKIGFEPLDYNKVGVYGDKAWIEKAQMPRERVEEFDKLVERLTRK